MDQVLDDAPQLEQFGVLHVVQGHGELELYLQGQHCLQVNLSVTLQWAKHRGLWDGVCAWCWDLW